MEDQNQTDKSDKAIETDEEYIGLKRSQITHFREVIEATAKVLVGVSVLSYIIGLLITNMHLRKYGVSHLSFAQFEYVLTGLLWLFLVGLSYVIYVIPTVNILIPIKPGSPKWMKVTHKLVRVLFHYLFSILALSLPLFVLSGFEIDQLSWGGFYVSLSLLTTPFFIDRFRKGAYGFFQAAKQRTLSTNAVEAFTGLVFVLMSLSGYTDRIYPKLSPVYGGGKQQRLILVVKSDQVAQLKSLGINVSPENRQIGPLEVIPSSTLTISTLGQCRPQHPAPHL